MKNSVNLSTGEISPKTGNPAGKSAVPSKEDVVGWVKRDLTASSYFLAMVLHYPDLIERLGEELYERILSDEQGALIDKITKAQEDGFSK